MSTHPIPVLLYEIIQELRARNPDHIPLIGVAGAQGSGKSYQCRILTMANQPRFAHFSLDDVYLTKAERVWRADNISSFSTVRDEDGNFEIRHVARPLVEQMLLTRGPPGTHDLKLAQKLIAGLREKRATPLPKFDKLADDRAPDSTWPTFQGPAEAIVIDGWCIGAMPSLPSDPINEVEQDDAEGIWRRETQTQLTKTYAPFFESFDAIVYLRPPNWEIVRSWRGQQEEQTLGRPLTAEENATLDRFVMFYERITRSMMAGNHRANWIVQLDEARKVTRIEEM